VHTQVICSAKNVRMQTESLPPLVPSISCLMEFGANKDCVDFT
jgi:hypothetical protein